MLDFNVVLMAVGKLVLIMVLLHLQQHLFYFLFSKDEDIKKPTILGIWVIMTMLMILLFVKSIISVNGLLESLGFLGLAFIFSFSQKAKESLKEGRWVPIVVNFGLTAAVVMIFFSLI